MERKMKEHRWHLHMNGLLVLIAEVEELLPLNDAGIRGGGSVDALEKPTFVDELS